MHLEPPTLWDYEYHKNLAPAAREITETLNEELKAVDGFLRIVPLGSSINVWRMRQACGRQSPYIGDLDCGVIIFTPQHKEHKVTKEISALTREYISSKGLHADRTVNPAQFYFNLHPNSTHEVSMIAATRPNEDIDPMFSYKLALPFLQDNPKIALLAYEKLRACSRFSDISMERIMGAIFDAIRHFMIPEMKHSGARISLPLEALTAAEQDHIEFTLNYAERVRQQFETYAPKEL